MVIPPSSFCRFFFFENNQYILKAVIYKRCFLLIFRLLSSCWVISVASSNNSINNTIGLLCTMLNGQKRETGDQSALITAELSSAYLCPNIRQHLKLMRSLHARLEMPSLTPKVIQRQLQENSRGSNVYFQKRHTVA